MWTGQAVAVRTKQGREEGRRASAYLSDLVRGQHDDVSTFVEALGGCKVANTLQSQQPQY